MDIASDNNVNAALRKETPAQPPVGDEYDHVYSFFLSAMTNAQEADLFATSLFRVAYQTQIPVLDLLSTLRGADKLTLTETMAYYLNGTRSPSAMLGVQKTVTPVAGASRNILD